ncbi:MAG: flippase-like domain-containing protein [Actinobacteria bacterium]|nr:flippase-like domain-containing protein [Actinomycetota bacterium]
MTVVPESTVVAATSMPSLADVPGSRPSRSLAVAALIGIPASAVFLFLAVRGVDLGAVWRTLQDVRLAPLLGAVACMAVVYWLQAARWRRIADTRLGQRRFVEMVVAGVAVNNVLPGRVGDLLRARWVSRGAFSGGKGLATVVIDRAFDILALAVFLGVSLPFVTDAGWVDRILVGTVAALALLVSVVVAARAYTRRRPRGRRRHRGLPRRFVRDTLEGLSDPISNTRVALLAGLSVGAWLTWATAAILAAKAVGIELSLVEALFVTAALNLGVAIPSSPGFVGTYQWLGVSALGVFGIASEAGLAFAIVMQAVWYVPTTLVGAGLLVAQVRGGFRMGAPARDQSSGGGQAGR